MEEPKPPELTTFFWSMLAYVEQLGAEYRDSATPPQRKEELRRELIRIYREAKDFQCR
jgi:hypothetical protein